MKCSDVRVQVAFLGVRHSTIVNRASEWSIVGVGALVREKFIQAAEYLKARLMFRWVMLAIVFSCFHRLKELI